MISFQFTNRILESHSTDVDDFLFVAIYNQTNRQSAFWFWCKSNTAFAS